MTSSTRLIEEHDYTVNATTSFLRLFRIGKSRPSDFIQNNILGRSLVSRPLGAPRGCFRSANRKYRFPWTRGIHPHTPVTILLLWWSSSRQSHSWPLPPPSTLDGYTHLFHISASESINIKMFEYMCLLINQ